LCGKKVVLVLSGGNLALDQLQRLLARPRQPAAAHLGA
jgi:hypothetical protein